MKLSASSASAVRFGDVLALVAVRRHVIGARGVERDQDDVGSAGGRTGGGTRRDVERRDRERTGPERGRERHRAELEREPKAVPSDQQTDQPVGGHRGERQRRDQERQHGAARLALAEVRALRFTDAGFAERGGGGRQHQQMQEIEPAAPFATGESRAGDRRQRRRRP